MRRFLDRYGTHWVVYVLRKSARLLDVDVDAKRHLVHRKPALPAHAVSGWTRSIYVNLVLKFFVLVHCAWPAHYILTHDDNNFTVDKYVPIRTTTRSSLRSFQKSSNALKQPAAAWTSAHAAKGVERSGPLLFGPSSMNSLCSCNLRELRSYKSKQFIGLLVYSALLVVAAGYDDDVGGLGLTACHTCGASCGTQVRLVLTARDLDDNL